jgi:hypothetical protein
VGGSGANMFSSAKKMERDTYQGRDYTKERLNNKSRDTSKYNKNDNRKPLEDRNTATTHDIPTVQSTVTTISQTKLSEILKENESVVIRIGTGKDSDGNYSYAKCFTTFNGSELVVTKCDLVESKMSGTKTEKVGEIVYKFMNELHTAGHIQRVFKPAVWKLCYVERNGKEFNLDELRNTA